MTFGRGRKAAPECFCAIARRPSAARATRRARPESGRGTPPTTVTTVLRRSAVDLEELVEPPELARRHHIAIKITFRMTHLRDTILAARDAFVEHCGLVELRLKRQDAGKRTAAASTYPAGEPRPDVVARAA